jgi:hypothetical protein
VKGDRKMNVVSKVKSIFADTPAAADGYAGHRGLTSLEAVSLVPYYPPDDVQLAAYSELRKLTLTPDLMEALATPTIPALPGPASKLTAAELKALLKELDGKVAAAKLGLETLAVRIAGQPLEPGAPSTENLLRDKRAAEDLYAALKKQRNTVATQHSHTASAEAAGRVASDWEAARLAYVELHEAGERWAAARARLLAARETFKASAALARQGGHAVPLNPMRVIVNRFWDRVTTATGVRHARELTE